MEKKKVNIVEILLASLSYGITAVVASYINFRVQGDPYSVLKLVLVFAGCYLVDFALILIAFRLHKNLKK